MATAKKAICMPSSIPTMHMKKKKRKTLTPLGMDGYLTVIMVRPVKSASKTTAKQNPRMASDITTRPQKKANVNPVFGGSLEMIGFPEMALRMFWIK